MATPIPGYIQSDYIRDHIFPLVKAKITESGAYEYGQLIGTGFLIGSNGHALTAAHVIEQCFDGNTDTDVVLALFWNIPFNGWAIAKAISYEKHPTEDVGVIKIDGDGWRSIFEVSDRMENGAREYHCYGYPREAAQEIKKLYEEHKERPDLIFTQGYVRRRITRQLYPTIIFRGEQFYELSEQVGEGNSGGPLILKSSIGSHKWQVFGIYIGEKSEGRVSYAVRAEAFAHWHPTLLQGNSVMQEAATSR
jgi:hypothetical protein